MKGSGAASALIKELDRQGIALRVREGKLLTKPALSTLPPALAGAVTRYKSQIIALLDERAPSPPDDEPLSYYPSDPVELLAFLRAHGVLLWTRGNGKIRWVNPAALPDEHLLGLLAIHKPAWLPLLEEEKRICDETRARVGWDGNPVLVPAGTETEVLS